jgi:2-dehydropantoate 2-reductase
VVAGAGSIGCYVGGRLAAAGRAVSLLCRPRIADELAAHGLTVSDRDGGQAHVDAAAFVIATDPATVLETARIVLVTVKSGATAEMAQHIARFAPPDAVVVSLQNGLDNAAILRAALPGRTVAAGMVPFNVAALGDGRFHRGTDGEVVIDAIAADTAAALSVPGLPVGTDADMAAVAWGKLLLNLNNALNALAGVPLRDQVGDRRWRRILAACIDEALAALKAAGIRPAKVGKVSPALLPGLLRLPDVLFRVAAAAQLKIDPKARSSMFDDLEQRRTTEIDQLQGAIVALAERQGLTAPTNRAVLERVKVAEQARAGSPRLEPGDVVAARPPS